MVSKFGVSWSDGSPDSLNTLATLTGATEKYDIAIAQSVTNQEHDISFLVAKLLGVVITSDQIVSIKTNSSSAADQTFILDGVSQIFWVKSGQSTPLIANPFTVDVTKLFLTTGAIGPAGANVSIRLLLTP